MLNEDYKEMLQILLNNKVKFLVEICPDPA